jgi:hypothetical protein
LRKNQVNQTVDGEKMWGGAPPAGRATCHLLGLQALEVRS